MSCFFLELFVVLLIIWNCSQPITAGQCSVVAEKLVSEKKMFWFFFFFFCLLIQIRLITSLELASKIKAAFPRVHEMISKFFFFFMLKF